MHSWEVAKWQDNIAEDAENGKLQLNADRLLYENLLNGILELSVQLAKFREEGMYHLEKQFKEQQLGVRLHEISDEMRVRLHEISDVMGNVLTRRLDVQVHYSPVFEVYLFGWKVFTIVSR